MITLRPVTEADMHFLRALYGSTRVEELAVVPWSTAEKEAFLDMQFHAQHVHYQTHYPEASFDVVEQAGEAIGRLYLDRRPDEIRIIDIALLPACRNQGIGSELLKQILHEGAEANLSVTIHVERFNPALHLYERLGFEAVEDKGVYLLMAWNKSGTERVHNSTTRHSDNSPAVMLKKATE